ncbi:MAG: hypothetical protein FJ135_00020 [Deltaproteobacteria bacterium]|nr:hypothetical protein [Deltaproteobacteria bacterium]
MTLSPTERGRRLVGKIGLVLGVILATAILDVAITRHLTHFNDLHVLPGQELPVDGPLPEKTEIKDIVYKCDSPDVKIVFDKTFTGHWLGGNRWRGQLQIDPEAKPGKYSLTVTPLDPEIEHPPVIYSITVYPDAAAWQQSSTSYYFRYFGISHWWVLVSVIPALLLTLLVMFYLSGRVDAMLARSGLAEIYRTRRVDNGTEISFGLGTRHGLRPGMYLTLQDGQGIPVGQIEVLEAFPDHSVALVDRAITVQAGYMVRTY